MYLNIQVKEEDQGKENKYDKNDWKRKRDGLQSIR